MAIVNLHDITGNIVEVDALTMVGCEELPEYTELSVNQQVQGLTRYPTVKVRKIQVIEKRQEIRKQLLENRDMTPTIPFCLNERKTFEQIRAERRARQANT